MAKKKNSKKEEKCSWWTGKKWKKCCWPKTSSHGPFIVRHGITFGSALALVLSYTKNESIVWAIVHGILSWFYVIYRIIENIGWF